MSRDGKIRVLIAKAGGLGAAKKEPTPDEVKALVADVLVKGDPVRGEAVFRRKDLQCVACHGVGGDEHPDVGPAVGAADAPSLFSAQVMEAALQTYVELRENYLFETDSIAFHRVTLMSTPDEQSRYKAMHDDPKAAARYPTAYYGQIARGKLGLGEMPIHAPPASAAQRNSVERLELVRAAEILYALNERSLVLPLMADLGEANGIDAGGAINEIIFKDPADTFDRKMIGVDDLKRVRETTAGVFERDGGELGRLAAGERFAIGKANAAGEDAGGPHFFGQPTMDLFMHGVGEFLFE